MSSADDVASESPALFELAIAHPVLASDAPERVVELAAVCVDYVRQAIGVEPDGTVESVSLVDHYLTLAREELSRRPEAEPLILQAVAAYFGELACGQISGFWLTPTADAASWRVCSRVGYLAIKPLGVAYDALHQSTAHDGPSSELLLSAEDRDLIEERLAAVPPLPEDELYLLSTRLETLEIVVETLRVVAREEGVDDLRFNAEDYADED